jgi:hypothetical protein
MGRLVWWASSNESFDGRGMSSEMKLKGECLILDDNLIVWILGSRLSSLKV